MLVRVIGGAAIAAGSSDAGTRLPGGSTTYVLELLSARFDIEGVRQSAVGTGEGEPRPLSSDRLIDFLYTNEPTPLTSKRTRVHKAVLEIRKLARSELGDDRPIVGNVRLRGYVLKLQVGDELDAIAFREMAEWFVDLPEAIALLEADRVSEELDRLWPDERDEPYENYLGFADEEFHETDEIEESRRSLMALREELSIRLFQLAEYDDGDQQPTGAESDAAESEPPPSVSILAGSGRVIEWLTGGRPDDGLRRWAITVALFVVSALIAASSVALGIAADFMGPAEPGSTALVRYNGFLRRLNWIPILLMAPVAVLILINFLRATDQAVAKVDQWVVPRRPGPPFSERFGLTFRRAWRTWRVVAPLSVAVLVLITEQNDWFSPVNDDAVWGDLDWAVAARLEAAPADALLLAFNTAVFTVEIYLISCSTLALGMAVSCAVSVAGAWHDKHWLRADYRIRDGAVPNLDDIMWPLWFLLWFMAFMLVLGIVSTIENSFVSSSGKDPGIILLSAAAVLVPVGSSIVVGVFWFLRRRFGITAHAVTLHPMMRGLVVLLAVLVVVNTALLVA